MEPSNASAPFKPAPRWNCELLLVLSAIFLVIYTARKCVLDIAALESAIEKEAVPAGSGSDGPAASSVESDQSQEAEIDEAALVEQKLAEEVWSEA